LTQSALPSGSVVTFIYNGDGQRVQKQDLAGTVQHLWDGENILLDTGPGNIIQGVYTLEPAVYGNLISQSRGFPGVDSFYLFDGSGSTRQLVSITGVNVTDSYLYDAFGNVLAGNLVTGTTNPFRYIGRQGYYYDMYWNGSVAEFLQYYLRARILNPATGRFLSRDPSQIGFRDANNYLYGSNNPLSWIDPSGEIPTNVPENPGWWKLYDRLQKHPKVRRNRLSGCLEIPMQVFQDELLKTFKVPIPRTNAQKANMARGCIGIASVLQSCGIDASAESFPQDNPNTKCFNKFVDAANLKCRGKSNMKFLFTIEGTTAPPDEFGLPPANINDSIDMSGDYNFIVYLRSPGNNYCLFANHCKKDPKTHKCYPDMTKSLNLPEDPANPQIVSFCHRMKKGGEECKTNDPNYPDRIYCVTCSSCTMEANK
jgi:RHS repeat-associated protein